MGRRMGGGQELASTCVLRHRFTSCPYLQKSGGLSRAGKECSTKLIIRLQNTTEVPRIYTSVRVNNKHTEKHNRRGNDKGKYIIYLMRRIRKVRRPIDVPMSPSPMLSCSEDAYSSTDARRRAYVTVEDYRRRRNVLP
jgi:hypothetical protein